MDPTDFTGSNQVTAHQGLEMPAPGEGAVAAQARPKTVEEQLREALARIEELKGSLSAQAQLSSVLRVRRRIGYGAGAGGALGLIGISVFSFWSLHGLAYAPYSELPPSYFWAVVAGHALITVALVYFCYQVIRAAERLILPDWWVEKHPDTAKAMLGMMDPMSTVTKAGEQVADIVGKTLGAVVNATKGSRP